MSLLNQIAYCHHSAASRSLSASPLLTSITADRYLSPHTNPSNLGDSLPFSFLPFDDSVPFGYGI